MKYIKYTFLLLVLINFNLYPSDYTILTDNIKDILYQTNEDKIIPSTKLTKFYNTNGEYKDIDYKSNDEVNWSGYHHMERLFSLAITYSHPLSAEKGNKAIIDNIVKGLAYWSVNKPISKNWWFNKIAVPEKVSQILLLLNGERSITSKLQNDLISLISFDLGSYTGVNRSRMASNQFLIGVLIKDDQLISSSRKEILSTLAIGNADGIQYDYSFHSHGNQLYTYGYGSSFIRNILDFCLCIRNTKFQIEKEKLEILNNYILKGYLPIIRKGYVDYNATGRVLSRKNALRAKDGEYILKSLSMINNNDTRILKQLASYSEVNTNFNKYYWTSDYLIHYTPSIYFSVRGVSNRTKKAEKGNNENLKGGNLSIGSVCVRMEGDEYDNIFPIWDWNLIPGTTTTLNQQAINTDWGENGKTSFVGGVSIPQYSLMTYNMNAKGVKADKSYFFFSDIMFCLGTNINSDSDKEVYTTINQCFLDKTLNIYTQNSELKLPKYFNITNNNIRKIIHRNIFYYFPDKTNLKIKAEKRKGSWRNINISGSNLDEFSDIISFVIPHGTKVSNASYSYIVAPNRRNIELDISTFDILANNDSIQAILDKKNNVMQVVFLKPSTLITESITLKVDEPLVMIIDKIGKTDFEVFLSDPSQKLYNATLTYGNQVYKINFPSGIYSGSTIKLKNK